MARGPEKEDSVYDFLYIDSRRLAIFLSQFSEFGHLTTLTRSATETDTSSGGIDIKIAKVDTGSSAQTGQTRQFDAQWIAPLSFLDQANARGMIARGLEDARIGRLTLVTGELALFDLAIMQSVWGLSYMKTLLLTAVAQPDLQTINRHDRRKQEKEAASKPPSPHEAALELLKMSPHRILTTIRVNGASVWSTLREDALIVSSSDLMLKHGVAVPGSWNILGVVDAFPDDQTNEAAQEQAATSLGALGVLISGLAPGIRGMLGRPAEAFGMTPFLIFREISGH